jgi:hypothetical protein
VTTTDAPDPHILRDWLAETLGRPVRDVAVELLPAGTPTAHGGSRSRPTTLASAWC